MGLVIECHVTWLLVECLRKSRFGITIVFDLIATRPRPIRFCACWYGEHVCSLFSSLRAHGTPGVWPGGREESRDEMLHGLGGDGSELVGEAVSVVRAQAEEGINGHAGAEFAAGLAREEACGEDGGAGALQGLLGHAVGSKLAEGVLQGFARLRRAFGCGTEVEVHAAGVYPEQGCGRGVVGQAAFFPYFGEDGAGHVVAPFIKEELEG